MAAINHRGVMNIEPVHIVREIILWIEQHLDDELTLDLIAVRAGYSPYHFSRMFLAHTRRTAMDYVRGRRLVRSARRLLAEPDLRLVELALDSGFDSQEAFTRAFKRMFGSTPARFRRGFTIEPLEGQYPMTALAKTTTNVTRLPELVTRDGFVVAGPARRFGETDKSDIPQLWSRLLNTVPIPGQRGGAMSYGVVSDIDRDKGTLNYLAGVEIGPDTALPEGFERRVIAPATYLVFRITFDGGPVHLQIAAALEEVWGNIIPTIGLKLAKGPDFECYDGTKPVNLAGSTMDYYVPVAASSSLA